MYQFLKIDDKEAIIRGTLENLGAMAARFETCQKVVNVSLRLKVSMVAENGRFNSSVFINIMYIDNKFVPHLVNNATYFSEACFLSGVSSETVWEAILTCWATASTGLPHKLMVDQISLFQKTFAELAELHEVKVSHAAYSRTTP